MATKKKAATKKFMAFRSDCGGAEQFSPVKAYGGSYIHASAQAAKDEIKDAISDGDVNEDGTYIVVEIVDVGTPSGVEWGRSVSDIS